MAVFDYTILSQSAKENRATAVCEYTVPGTNNNAGVAWATVVSEVRAADGNAGTTANPRKRTDTGYVDSLDAGTVVERTLTVEYDAGLAPAAKLTQIETLLNDGMDDYVADFTGLYRFYGSTGAVT